MNAAALVRSERVNALRVVAAQALAESMALGPVESDNVFTVRDPVNGAFLFMRVTLSPSVDSIPSGVLIHRPVNVIHS